MVNSIVVIDYLHPLCLSKLEPFIEMGRRVHIIATPVFLHGISQRPGLARPQMVKVLFGILDKSSDRMRLLGGKTALAGGLLIVLRRLQRLRRRRR